jgi:hypothetical protein
MWLLLLSIQNLRRRRNYFSSLSRNNLIFSVHSRKTSPISIGAEYTKYFMYFHKKKSHGVRSIELTGDTARPFRPIHCAEKNAFNQFRTIYVYIKFKKLLDLLDLSVLGHKNFSLECTHVKI